ncbi:TipC family immunity protein [Streptococcus sp. LYSM12]|uniref:TipC family immunity protein n=2 Tax=Streptococcus TaxID=1301 RepID=UPI001FD76326|nr:TipC family immunity protein [Streptococcus sp. LYSM12]
MSTLVVLLKVAEFYDNSKIYRSLDNVFLEMNYAEVNSGDLPNLPDFSTVIDGSQSFRDPEQLIGIGIHDNLSDDERIQVIVGIEETFIIEYRRLLTDNIYLYISYTYRDYKLRETIEISNSDNSLVWSEAGYWIDKRRGKKVDLQEYLKGSYWFSSTKGLPSLQLTDIKEVLEYLKPYGIDANWIREKSDYMLYDVVLKRWFEKGSQRYSFGNLGNVKIERLDMVQ